MRTFGHIIAALIASTVLAGDGIAAAISVNNLNIFRDTRSINDVGAAQGDQFQFGADIVGGSAGTSLAGIFTPTGSPTPTLTQSFFPCNPLAVNQNHCSRSAAFNTSRLNGTWQVEFQQGTTVATFALPSVTGIPLTPVPFPTSVSITGNGINPTISYALPTTFVPNDFRINIHDRSSPLPSGRIDIIHSVNIAPGIFRYTIPTNLSSSTPGNPVSLIPGHQYTIQFEVIETRDGNPIPPGSGNADILTRSSSYFDFTPPAPGTPQNIALPMVSGTTGVYQFSGVIVGPGFVTFIDPAVAVGYIYDTAQGDPNFASVDLPDVDGGKFTLSYLVGGQLVTMQLDAGVQFFFPQGGVSEFTVTGIDPSADLDPSNTLAFITGLTFVSSGFFDGTMTPITLQVEVPEPASIAVLGLGLVGALMTRRRRVHQG